jgi:hypothetical protein
MTPPPATTAASKDRGVNMDRHPLDEGLDEKPARQRNHADQPEAELTADDP